MCLCRWLTLDMTFPHTVQAVTPVWVFMWWVRLVGISKVLPHSGHTFWPAPPPVPP